MAWTEEHMDLFDQFLKNKLSETDRKLFELRLQSDKEFNKNFIDFMEIQKGIDCFGDQELNENLMGVRSQLEKEGFFEPIKAKFEVQKNNKLFFRKYRIRPLAIAASILLITVSGYFFFKFQNDPIEKVFAQYYQPETEEIKDVLRELMPFGLVDPERGRKDSLAFALRFYQGEQYEDAGKALSIYCKYYPDEPIGRFYMGLNFLQLGEYTEASQRLESLALLEGFELEDQIKWYLALSLMKINTPESKRNAIKLIRELANSPQSEYQNSAANIMDKIN